MFPFSLNIHRRSYIQSSILTYNHFSVSSSLFCEDNGQHSRTYIMSGIISLSSILFAVTFSKFLFTQSRFRRGHRSSVIIFWPLLLHKEFSLQLVRQNNPSFNNPSSKNQTAIDFDCWSAFTFWWKYEIFWHKTNNELIEFH